MNSLIIIKPENRPIRVTANQARINMITENHVIQLRADKRIINIESQKPVSISVNPHVIYQYRNDSNILQLSAADNIGGHKVIAADNTGKAIYASCDNISQANKVVGISINAAIQDANLTIVTRGEITESSWNWNLSKNIYLGLNGTLTQTLPAADFLLQVAKPITATKIFVNIETPIFIN